MIYLYSKGSVKMNLIQVFILGVVQGIAEFLPISSSAHLIIFRDIFGIGSFLTGKYEMSFDISRYEKEDLYGIIPSVSKRNQKERKKG